MQSFITLLGVNHTTASVETREKCHFTQEDLDLALSSLREIDGVEEAVILSTCNRVEIAVLSLQEHARQDLEAFLYRNRSIHPGDIENNLYHFFGIEAVRHIFQVASSLDSMIVGEPQILGQTKEALEASVASGSARGLLRRAFEKAFHVAKRVRTETGIADGAVSIGYAAVMLARNIFSDLSQQHVLVIGAGEMAETVIENLRAQGKPRLIIANRNYERALVLAEKYEGRAIRLDQLDEVIDSADIIVSSTSHPGILLSKDKIRNMLKARKNKPLFIIDIALPRDIDPKAADLPGVFIYDLDDLQEVARESAAKRTHEASRAQEIIDEEVTKFQHHLDVLEIDPVIGLLRDSFESIRRKELDRALSQLSGLDGKNRKILEQMTSSIINKIAHTPIHTLKSLAKNGSSDSLEQNELADSLQRLFRLDPIESCHRKFKIKLPSGPAQTPSE